MHTDTIPAHLTMSTPAEVVAERLRQAGPEAEIEILGRADGYEWAVELMAPDLHPASGANIPARSVRVEATIYMAADPDEKDGTVTRPDLRTDALVFNEAVHARWGWRGQRRMYRYETYGGATLTEAAASALAALRLEHDAAVARVDARAVAIAAEDARYAAALAR
jgi:hypothetical protein